MSLTNPAKKMSKSDANEKSQIVITDDAETIMRKVKKAVTDSKDSITFDPENRPGLANLLQLLYYAEGKAESPESLAKDLDGVSKKALKERVGKAIVDLLEPVRERYAEVVGNEKLLKEVAEEGAAKASKSAEATMRVVKDAIGF